MIFYHGQGRSEFYPMSDIGREDGQSLVEIKKLESTPNCMETIKDICGPYTEHLRAYHEKREKRGKCKNYVKGVNVAKVEAKMQSLGVEEASCCGKIFERGEQMSAVVSDSGEPLGWYCDQCIENWKREND